jgi:hypothetical protein
LVVHDAARCRDLHFGSSLYPAVYSKHVRIKHTHSKRKIGKTYRFWSSSGFPPCKETALAFYPSMTTSSWMDSPWQRQPSSRLWVGPSAWFS